MGKGCCGGSSNKQDHFKGKSAFEHLKEARSKTGSRMDEAHGLNTKGSMICALDAAKETALLFCLLFFIEHFSTDLSFTTYIYVMMGWLVWKAARGGFLGWARLEKLHRVIEEERHEIEYNREQEKEELIELYRLKGFEGDLLNQVIDVLMADDNRLLGIMLEEELGLRTGQYEHPLKLAFGNLCGVLISAIILLCASFFIPFGVIIFAFIIVGIAAFFHAKIEGIRKMHMVVWNMACLFIATGAAYFISEALRS
ncbi:MAG: VIT1/CCC1 transporter family protein [Rhabdochlamydiaceae bacterium]|nr:VIT1/CCC1 transporter family protein [Candidatus Amphrikana amoebophyrae]